MNTTNKRKHKKLRKPVKLVISLLLLVCVSVGGTVAYLTSKGSVTNQFTVGNVNTEVDEDFDGTVKKNVTAKNTGDVPAFIRIKLVTFRVNEKGDHIGGTAEIPEFKQGEGWFKSGDCYYYSYPVKPNEYPANGLIGNEGISLTGSYSDADGGKQVIEVIAEAIQASPFDAVKEAWGLECNENGNLIDPSTVTSNEEVQQ